MNMIGNGMESPPARSFQETPDAAEFPPATPVSVAYGDGIGPEIMDASLQVLKAAGGRLAIEQVEIGEQFQSSGGITAKAWESLRRTKVLYKAPMTTPQGGGHKSINVTLRKSLGMYANIRPAKSFDPFVATDHPGMDVVVIRENEEDVYAGIEHRQTDEVYQCLKLVSRPGCERIVRYAFEFAKVHGRRKVTCLTKDNIMKMTDGLFHQVFDEVAAEYPDIEVDHLIVDIGAAKLAAAPETFDVIVTSNLYGDIISDIAAEISGSVGLGPSANIGDHCAMFEAIHGSAPTIAGQDLANPSGLLLAGVMMLVHVGQREAAEKVHNAWLATIEDGMHTTDIFDRASSARKLGTKEFTDQVIARLGKFPSTLKSISYRDNVEAIVMPRINRAAPAKKDLVGVDVFIHSTMDVNALAETLRAMDDQKTTLQMITNRGQKVWPDGLAETFCTDHWRCRFLARSGEPFSKETILNMLETLNVWGIDFIKTENLYEFDGERGYSLGQGQ